MFGFRPTAISTALILAGATSALFAAAGSASAQQGCVSGYQMLKGQIPIACATTPQHSVFGAGMRDEPLTTGSINRSVHPSAFGATRATSHVSANTDGSCIGGFRWVITPANGDTLPMRCE